MTFFLIMQQKKYLEIITTPPTSATKILKDFDKTIFYIKNIKNGKSHSLNTLAQTVLKSL